MIIILLLHFHSIPIINLILLRRWHSRSLVSYRVYAAACTNCTSGYSGWLKSVTKKVTWQYWGELDHANNTIMLPTLKSQPKKFPFNRRSIANRWQEFLLGLACLLNAVVLLIDLLFYVYEMFYYTSNNDEEWVNQFTQRRLRRLVAVEL